MADLKGTDGGLRELALFAGAGGGILGGHLLGWKTVCAVEREPYAASVLMQRQNDGILPPFPIWDDVCTFDGRPWRGLVDVVSGGFPCQDISSAGNGAGIDGERSGLWREMARIIGEVRPRFVFVENSPLLVARGLAVVVSDLAEMGYDAEWCCISASDTGAPHKRDRIWLVANSGSGRLSESQGGKMEQPWRAEIKRAGIEPRSLAYASELQRDGVNDHAGISMAGKSLSESGDCCGSQDMADAVREREQRIIAGQPDAQVWQKSGERQDRSCGYGGTRWPTEPDVGRVANGVAARVDRLKAIGNGQVPRVAATAFTMMAGEL